MFILYIGLKNASLLSFSANPGSFIPLGDSMKLDSSIIPALTFANDSAKLALVGIFLNIGFLLRGTKRRDAAQYYYYFDVGLLSAIFQRLAVGAASPGSMPIGDLSETFGKCLSGFVQLFDISKGVGVMIFSLFSVMITMTIADMFDTIGTVLATASRANLVDEDGNIINGERILLADATATVMGAFFGTSTVTTYVESSTGGGGRRQDRLCFCCNGIIISAERISGAAAGYGACCGYCSGADHGRYYDGIGYWRY